MKISYQIRHIPFEDFLTDCPFDIPEKVGSEECSLCKNFRGHDKQNQIVLCEKSFSEKEINDYIEVKSLKNTAEISDFFIQERGKEEAKKEVTRQLLGSFINVLLEKNIVKAKEKKIPIPWNPPEKKRFNIKEYELELTVFGKEELLIFIEMIKSFFGHKDVPYILVENDSNIVIPIEEPKSKPKSKIKQIINIILGRNEK